MFSVAQICNLLYRRIGFCGALARPVRSNSRTLCRLQIGDMADYKSALLRLRSRVPTDTAATDAVATFNIRQPASVNPDQHKRKNKLPSHHDSQSGMVSELT